MIEAQGPANFDSKDCYILRSMDGAHSNKRSQRKPGNRCDDDTQDTGTRYTDSRQEVRGCRGGCSTANQDKTPLTKMEHFEMTMFMLEER